LTIRNGGELLPRENFSPFGPKKASSLLSLKALEKPRRAPTKRREAPMALRREVDWRRCLIFLEKRSKERKKSQQRKERKRKSMLANFGQTLLFASPTLSRGPLIPVHRCSKLLLTMFVTKRGSGGGGGGGGGS